MKRLISAPTAVNLELTELCNVKCRHCYNFWRDESMGSVSLDKDKIDGLVKSFVDAGVFHVIVTGGEPMAQFDMLEYTLGELTRNNISISCNSNLTLATDEKCKRLAAVGLDHILTSMPSCDATTTDYIMHQVGAFERILAGMKAAVRNGIRVSANMVITRSNMHQVYDTARLVAETGGQKLFITRAVPPTYGNEEDIKNCILTPEETKATLDEAIRARDDFGIMIGTLVSYPLCFLSDLERYADFVGRGCPAQAGNVIGVNANGETHACVHEEESYGNILTQPIREVFQSANMRRWHDGSYHYAGCDGCRYIDVCDSGCAMTAVSTEGEHGGQDPLFVGPHAFSKHYKVISDPKLLEAIQGGARFVAPKRLRFRREDGFHLLNVRWANSFPVADEIAEFLMRHRDSGQPFTLAEFGADREELLAALFFKDAVESPDYHVADKRQFAGLSFNIDAVSQFA